jgi:hypothetical protein
MSKLLRLGTESRGELRKVETLVYNRISMAITVLLYFKFLVH